MRRSVLFGLVLLVALAGCSTLLQGDAGSSIETYPPGVTEDGTVNETELVRVNMVAMNESVVRVDHRNGNDSSVVVMGPEETYSRDAFGTTWSGPHTSVDNGTFGDVDYALNYQRNVTVRNSGGGPMRFGLVVRLSSGQYEHVGTETVDGRRLHELELVRPTGMASVVQHYEATALVDDDGRLHRLDGEVGDSEANATEFRYVLDWEVDSVPRPPWLDVVPRIEANETADGTALAVTVRDGPSIPANTTLEFYHDGLEGEVTLAKSLDPGDTLYVGYDGTREAGEVVSSREPLDGDELRSLRGDRTSLDGTVTLEDGTVVSIAVDVGTLDLDS